MTRMSGLLCSVGVALCLGLSPPGQASPKLVKPPAAVPAEPELQAALAATLHESVRNTEYEEFQLGEAIVVSDAWQLEKSSAGVTVGQSKRVDVLARAPSKKCYVVHFKVIQGFDGQHYVNSYKA